MAKVVEAALGLLILLLILALALPWGEANAPAVRDAGTRPSPAVPNDRTPEAAGEDPAKVAALFAPAPESAAPAPASAGAKTIGPETPPPQIKKEPLEVPWLLYVAFTADADGTPFYFFKDTRIGKVIRLSPGVASGDWTLLSMMDGWMIVRFKEETYKVKKR